MPVRDKDREGLGKYISGHRRDIQSAQDRTHGRAIRIVRWSQHGSDHGGRVRKPLGFLQARDAQQGGQESYRGQAVTPRGQPTVHGLVFNNEHQLPSNREHPLQGRCSIAKEAR